MNNILAEVDVVLEEIQDLLVDFIPDQNEDEEETESENSRQS